MKKKGDATNVGDDESDEKKKGAAEPKYTKYGTVYDHGKNTIAGWISSKMQTDDMGQSPDQLAIIESKLRPKSDNDDDFKIEEEEEKGPSKDSITELCPVEHVMTASTR